jgi:type II secretory pathway pseudopilin PulG
VPLLLLTACSSPADVRADHDRTLEEYQREIDDAQGAIASAQDQINLAQDSIRTENARLPGDVAVAESWNNHWWGIPAGGWVAILIVASVGLAVVLSVWAYFYNVRRRLRQRRAHDLSLERERTEQRRLAALKGQVERGNCQVCGAAPVPDEVIEEVTRERKE